MAIFVLGINHNTAPLNVREKFYFSVDKLGLYLQDLLSQAYAEEAVLISTCNRSELYCVSNDIALVREWFCNQTLLSVAELEPLLYQYKDEKAVAHIMQVACGLDSMILGEPQILGQLKEAFSESAAAGAIGTAFHRVFNYVFSFAKEIRTTTAIGACPVSVASSAIYFARQKVKDVSQAKILLIGAGGTTELLLRYLHNLKLSLPVTMVNRNTEKAETLVTTVGAPIITRSLDDLIPALIEADLVFSATGSAIPIVSKAMVDKALYFRASHKPLTIIDIAVPRDIDPLVASLSGVHLFCIDDLQQLINQNRQGREHAADKARQLIHQRAQEFMQEYQAHANVNHAIRAYRGQIEEICQAELTKAKIQLQQGRDPQTVLDNFAFAFTQKLLHTPSVQLRQAGAEGRFELLKLAKKLFAVPDAEIEHL